tara:strand:- start:1101 stop:2363 length:1263 start_codon:yes stop_codon:yes gene_type:complete
LVITCNRCLYTSNHPLGITFNNNGLCSGCLIHEEKDSIDWQDRFLELNNILRSYRSSEAKYDCIVPVSGGKDSYFIVHQVVNILKMKPLLVSYNKLFNTSTGIDNLANLRIQFDVDLMQKNINPNVVKAITRETLQRFGNPYWHCIAGETVYPVQMAVMLKIPLIIWGAHQGLEQVGMFSHFDNVEMTRRYRKDHDLFGNEANDLLDTFNNLNEEDVLNYRYPPFSDIEAEGIRGIYLGNYIRWDPLAQHQQMVRDFGFKGLKFSRNFDTYDYNDSFVYSGIHDILKLYKYGYSKVTDHACREIRFGRLTREQGKKLVHYYQAQQPDFIDLFTSWLGMTNKSLSFVANSFRNKKLWKETQPNKWELIIPPVTKGQLTKVSKLNYPNSENSSDKKFPKKFITIGKGVDWPSTKKTKDIKWL